MKKEYIIYRIWYSDLICYVGQTIQSLETRMKQHFWYDKDLDIKNVSKIQYSILKTQADLNVYEIYFINKYRAFENRSGFAGDKLNLELPELEWKDINEVVFKELKSKTNIRARSLSKNYNLDERFV